MPTQKIASIPERVIPAQEAVLTSFEIGMGGKAHLNFTGFNTSIDLSDSQKDRILAIILENASASEALKDATIEDRVIADVVEEEVARPE